jgi:hypothetical protein
MSTTEQMNNNTTSVLADVLAYVKEKQAMVEKEQSKSTEYTMQNEFLSGLWNAYEDVRFVLEEGSFNPNKEL